VHAYSYKDGKLTSIQTISAIPADYKGSVGSADIHVSPDGKFLYASNRGESNTIAIFSVAKDGKLTLVGHQSTLGKTPRNFNLDPSGNFLLVANQNGNNIVIFRRDKKTGLLSPLEKQIEVPNPVCIKWASD
jgi:6-phosphogluconolactonase